MNPYIKIYFYSDGSKESKRLFSEGTAKGFAEHNLDTLEINVGDRFELIVDEKDVTVMVYEKTISFDDTSIEYHVAPVEVSPYQFNK